MRFITVIQNQPIVNHPITRYHPVTRLINNENRGAVCWSLQRTQRVLSSKALRDNRKDKSAEKLAESEDLLEPRTTLSIPSTSATKKTLLLLAQ